MFTAKAETVITADEGVRGGKIIPLKQTVDNAITGCECVKRVLVATRTGANVPMVPDRDYKLEELIAVESTECPPEPMNSEDPLFMLYTSGSTGKPKGILHTQAGYLLYTGLTQQVVDSSIFPSIHPSIYPCIHSFTHICIYLTTYIVKYVFDYKPGDIFACVADIGWITGHSHSIYGPLSNGGTSVMFESIPIYPDPG